MKQFLLFFFILLYSHYNLNSQIRLSADGKTDTYELVSKAFMLNNRKAVEVPDCNHTAFGQHITQKFDSTLKKYVFQFDIHIEGDFDRCKRFDRQRNEIKTNKNSYPTLLATENETIQYKWKFRIDKNFQASPKYTTLHQITYHTKDGNEPLLAFSAREKKEKKRFQVLLHQEASNRILAKTNLSAIAGQWIVADETIHFAKNGSYSLTLTTLEGEQILDIHIPNLETWLDEMIYARPKWGIYRSLKYAKMLRDETLYFADFEIDDISEK